jgi:hypothetical protein
MLGLFFLTTGASVEPSVIQEELPTVLALLAGLIGAHVTILHCTVCIDIDKCFRRIQSGHHHCDWPFVWVIGGR